MLQQLFFGQTVAQAVVALSISIFMGLALGRIRIAGVSLGVGGVLFGGLIVGHFGMAPEHHILIFARESGLILFIYAIGMSVGPTFLESFRKVGPKLNILAAFIVAAGALITVICFKAFDLPMPVAVGLFSGAVTNTPSLSAASQMFAEVTPDAAAAAESVRSAGTGYAVAYPFGIFGIILTMLLVRAVFKVDIGREKADLAEERRAASPDLVARTLRCTNAAFTGRKLGEIAELRALAMTVSRVRDADGSIHLASDSTVVEEGMDLHCVADAATLRKAEELVGPEADINLAVLDTNQKAVDVYVSRVSALDRTIADLGLVPERGERVTRLFRTGTEILATSTTRLHLGDRLRVIANEENLTRVRAILGNDPHAAEHPQVTALFAGIFAGIVLGSIPVFIPGLPAPLKLGLAGGPLIVSILLARKHRLFGMTFFMTNGANLMVREIGISLFLACVGINAGAGFLDTLLAGPGLRWMAIASLITIIPLLLAAFLGMAVLRIRYGTLCGVLSGSMTDPPALAFATDMLGTNAAAAGYASVYPLTMVLRIFAGQMLVLLLSAM